MNMTFNNWVRRWFRVGLLTLLMIAVVSAGLPLQSAVAQDAPKKFFPANDPAYYYFGRTERAVDTLWTWPGTGLRVAYSNSPHVSIRLWANNFHETSSENMPKYIWYRIDRGQWQRQVIGAGNLADFPLTVPGDSRTHTLDVIKASEGQLTFQGLMLEDFGTLQPAAVPDGKIEFFGDSITAGFRIYGGGSYDAVGDHDAKASYAWLTAERLNAQARLIAVTGRGLVKNFGIPPSGDVKTLPAYYPMLHREYGTENNWSAWQPSVIVVNVGTNDMTGPAFTPPAEFQNAYTTLLTTIRNFNPGALIIALQPFGLKNGTERVFPKEIEGAVALRKAAGDNRVAFVSTNGWLGKSDFTDGVHPNARGHAKAAARLASIIPVLNRQTVVTSDTAPADSPAQAPAAAAAPAAASSGAPNTNSVASECRGPKASRLALGQNARVIIDGRGPTPIRDAPGGKIIAKAPEGTILKIFDGPRCYRRALYWLAYLPDGSAGWVVESDALSYYIEPG